MSRDASPSEYLLGLRGMRGRSFSMPFVGRDSVGIEVLKTGYLKLRTVKFTIRIPKFGYLAFRHLKSSDIRLSKFYGF